MTWSWLGNHVLALIRNARFYINMTRKKILDMEICVCCVFRVGMNVSMSKLLKARPAAVNADLILTNKPLH